MTFLWRKNRNRATSGAVDLPFRRLSALCRQWGGRVRLVSFDAYERTLYGDNNPWDEAPFTDWHAINWDAKEILVARPGARAASLVHEMGHVFADPKRPEEAYEWDWFGWEYRLALQVGCLDAWMAHNKDYGTGSADFGDLDRAEQMELLAARVEEGIQIGIITSDGTPIPWRPNGRP